MIEQFDAGVHRERGFDWAVLLLTGLMVAAIVLMFACAMGWL